MSLNFQTGNAILEIKRDSSEFKVRPAEEHVRGCVALLKY